MRVRTFLAAGAFAVTAILGSAGSALADDHDESRGGGDYRSCSEFAGAGAGGGESVAFYGATCTGAHWENGHGNGNKNWNGHEKWNENGHDNGQYDKSSRR